jgi:hypothetical protein
VSHRGAGGGPVAFSLAKQVKEIGNLLHIDFKKRDSNSELGVSGVGLEVLK